MPSSQWSDLKETGIDFIPAGNSRLPEIREVNSCSWTVPHGFTGSVYLARRASLGGRKLHSCLPIRIAKASTVKQSTMSLQYLYVLFRNYTDCYSVNVLIIAIAI